MVTKKVRRHSGREENVVYDPQQPYESIRWSEWDNYRDGMRDIWPGDVTLFKRLHWASRGECGEEWCGLTKNHWDGPTGICVSCANKKIKMLKQRREERRGYR